MPSQITYRFVCGTEMEKVARKLVADGQVPPNPILSCAWLAEDMDGNIVGMAVLHSVPVVEYMHGPTGEIIKHLFGMAEEFILASEAPRVIMHSSNRAMCAMLKFKGAEASEDTWFNWQPVAKEALQEVG